jgi:hypothetical protein
MIDGVTRLLHSCELEGIARAIRDRGKLGRPEYYFRNVRLGEPVPDDGLDGEDLSPDAVGIPSGVGSHI